MLPAQAVQAGAAVERLAAARSAPLLLASCADGRLQLFDLRNARAAAATLLSPSASPLARAHEHGLPYGKLATTYFPVNAAQDSKHCMPTWMSMHVYFQGFLSIIAHLHHNYFSVPSTARTGSWAQIGLQTWMAMVQHASAHGLLRLCNLGSPARCVGLVAEACRCPHQAAARTAAGELRFSRLQAASRPCAWKSS